MESEQRIREDMTETRESLTEKLQRIEDKVAGTVEDVTQTVQGATSAVAETVGTIKDTVADGVDTVKGWFDIPSHVDRHPWFMMGGAMALGYLAEALVHQVTTPAVSDLPAAGAASEKPQGGPRTNELRLHHTGNGHRPRRRHEAASSGSSLLKLLGPELNKLKSLAFGVMLGTVRELVSRSLPEHMGHELKQIFDDATRKIGGLPVPASDWDEAGKRGGEYDRGVRFPKQNRDAG